MKPLLLTLASLATLASIPITPTPIPQLKIVKTIRMTQLEDRFHVQIVGVLRDSDTDYWVFMERQIGISFDRIPVVIKEGGSDHDMEVARVAAENCASFYEVQIQKARAHPTPVAGDAFSMPTHPPREVER
jgi:hypothetical protein